MPIRAVDGNLLRAAVLVLAVASWAHGEAYPWLAEHHPEHALNRRFEAPPGYRRVAVEAGTFGAWLRGLPLKPGCPPVYLYSGTRKRNQSAHAAVIDLPTGDRDLQQCADAVIRLRAEYLYARGAVEAIHFNFTSGDRAGFAAWLRGRTPVIRGSMVTWEDRAPREQTHAALQSYLALVFAYAGTLSLSREMDPVDDIANMQVGDVFIQGGSPGHAVLVVDMAVRGVTGQRAFLLAQSYMPAQDMHLLRNPTDATLSPWYEATAGHQLVTPEWTFTNRDLRRFREEPDRPSGQHTRGTP